MADGGAMPRATRHPVPAEALDDRLAFVGTSGSGKTYNAGTAIERLLGDGARAVIVDPLGVWWGLRSTPDGKRASPFDVVIFGGPHGDLPLTENAGALIGETAAAMAESCILDLSEIGTAAGERRFVAAFLRALYTAKKSARVAGAAALLHLVLDEADMWAPQTISEKDGGTAALLAITERIVRRGRVDGFIPWLITQRPAQLSKSVLSQADGLVAMKLTLKHDRDALDGWIAGQADVETGKRIKASLPALQVGEGVVWIPGRGLLDERARFPKKTTFDSSRAPKRGETRPDVTLNPLDLGALREKLAGVEAEAKANDPTKLKAEVARLQRELAAAKKHPAAAPLTEAERTRIFAEGAASRDGDVDAAFADGVADGAERTRRAIQEALGRVELPTIDTIRRDLHLPPRAIAPPVPKTAGSVPNPPSRPASGTALPPNAPAAKVLAALAWWMLAGHEAPTRRQVAAVAGVNPTGSTLRGYLATLSAAGLISYPSPGQIALTGEGLRTAPVLDPRPLHDFIRDQLNDAQRRTFDALVAASGFLSRADLAARLGVEPAGSTLRGYLAALSALELIDYRDGGVALQDWVME